MKKNIVICMAILFSISITWASPALSRAEDMEALKQELKDCNDEACKEKLQNDAEEIFDAAGRKFNDNFVTMGTEIVVKHCHSLIQEMFYHMQKVKSYYNFKDVFYLKKLKELKKNRDKFDRQKISEQDFTRTKTQAEAQYKQDIRESQDFIDEKVMRLKELTQNLSDNVDSITGTARVKKESIPGSLKQIVLRLKNDPVWIDFNDPNEGRKIREAILLASHDNGKEILPRLRGIFSGFDSGVRTGTVFSDTLMEEMENTNQ